MKDLVNFLSGLSESLKSCSRDIETFINSKNFDLLKSLLFSDEWPRAAQDDQICDFSSEEHKSFRAKNCLNVFGLCESKLLGKRFLDFGCGEGHVVREAAKRGAISFGFDVNQNPLWSSQDMATFFSNWASVQDEVSKNGKFDYVFLYDVLDHLTWENVSIASSKIHDVCKEYVFIRCHPFCSRHGYHLHTKLNKAFVHLVFSPDELFSLNLIPAEKDTIFVVNVDFYTSLFSKKFNIISEHKMIDSVDNFFKANPFIMKRIKDRWYSGLEQNEILSNLSCSFIDFILKPTEPISF